MIRTALKVLLASTVIVAGGIGMSMVVAQEQSSETYVHNVGPLIMHPQGQVCIEQMSPTVNRVILTNTTHFSTEFYHYNTDRDVFIEVPKLHSDWIVLYSNGSNPLVDRLASIPGEFCTPPGMDVRCSISLDEYNISTSVQTPKGLDVVGGPDAADSPPRPRSDLKSFIDDGCIDPGLLNNSSSASTTPRLPVEPGGSPVNETVGNATDTVNATTELVNGTIANTTEPVNESIDDHVDKVNETTDPVEDVVDDTVETVSKTVDDTVDTVSKTVDDTVDTVSETVGGGNDSTANDSEAVAGTDSGSDGGVLSVGAGPIGIGLF